MHCPRCPESVLVPTGRYPRSVHCPNCGGYFLPGGEAKRLVEEDVGVDAQTFVALANEMGRAGPACPSCEGAMHLVALKGTDVDWCEGCGAMWLDANELSTLTRGRVIEEAPVAAVVPHADFEPSTALASVSSEELMRRLDYFLGRSKTIGIRQEVNLMEMLFDLEMANRYSITTNTGAGCALETTDGWLGLIKRLLLTSHRPLDVEILDASSNQVLSLTRPFYFFFSTLTIETPDQTPIGVVEKRFAFLWTNYDLFDNKRRVFAQIKKPFWRFWKFPIVDMNGNEIAVIRKRWVGFFQEALTTADRFTVEIIDDALTLEQRAVIFSAAFSVDLDSFQRRGRSSLTDSLTDF